MRRMALIAVVAALAAAACGSPGAGEQPRPSSGAGSCSTRSLHLVHPGRLTIGTDNPAYSPYFGGGHPKGSEWKLNDPHTGKGFESAVAYAVAGRLGFSTSKVDWVVAPFGQTYAPGPKDYDFAIEQISYNAKRAQAVDFSDSYYEESEALVAVK